MYEVRAMSLGEILDTGFRILRNHFALLVGIAAVVYVPPQVFSTGLTQNAELAMSPALIAAAAIVLLIYVVGWPIVFAAITHAVGQLYLGREVSFAESLRFGVSILFPLAGTTILYWLALVGGTILFIIPGIYFALAFMLIWQVMVLERIFGPAALRRSRELMQGNMLRGFGVLFVCGLIVAILGSVLELALGFIPWLGPIGSALAQSAGAAYSAAVSVVFYFDIRCRKEAFDIEHLVQLVETNATPAANPQPG